MAFKIFKYRMYPTQYQERNLFLILEISRQWYNMCISERKYSYEIEHYSVSKRDQLRLIKYYKSTFPCAQQVHSHILQVVTSDVDKAFQTFFRRVKAGEKPGYPRFKKPGRFRSFGLKELNNGFKLDGRRLKLSGVGRVALRWHRPIEGAIKTIRIVHKAGKWFVLFSCNIKKINPFLATNKPVGIDMGISALITTSYGDKINNPLYYHKSQKRISTLQRKLARAHKNSHNYYKIQRSIQLQHEHVANQRKDFLHKLSTNLVREFDQIALEDLNIHKMAHNHLFSKSISDSGWYLFRQYLTYKAENAGREIVFVNPAYTSKSCSNCGATFKDFDLSTRWVECGCGLSLDRDHNAAINILNKTGWDTSVPDNVECKQTHASVKNLRSNVQGVSQISLISYSKY